ncbi:MAG: hypothetical protein NC124_11390 [Clostridium sp.]|nr:hypothetical protein [Clostridium sp.]
MKRVWRKPMPCERRKTQSRRLSEESMAQVGAIRKEKGAEQAVGQRKQEVSYGFNRKQICSILSAGNAESFF